MHIRIISVLQHDVAKMIASIKALKREEGICRFYPAWDHMYSAGEMKEKLEEAEELIRDLRKTITESDAGQDLRDLTKLVSEKMKMQILAEPPCLPRQLTRSERNGNELLSCH